MAGMTETDGVCGERCHLCADVVAAVYAPPEDQPRELICERSHPHVGHPHRAEGWAWENGSIWRVGEHPALIETEAGP